MARPFSPKEAKDLVSYHSNLRESLKIAPDWTKLYLNEITAATEQMQAKSAEVILKDVPVDAINIGENHFRISALKEAGYNTVADLVPVTPFALSMINGISQESAYGIKHTVEEMVAKAHQGAKIQLSFDEQTPEATRLVTALYKYKASEPLVIQVAKISDESKEIDSALARVIPGTGHLRWMFASSEVKQQAEAAFNLLRQYQTNGYGEEANALLKGLREIGQTTQTQAWEEFKNNPISFFNALEKLVPGALGTDDEKYGLPEELAAGVAGEQPILTGLHCELRRYQEWGVKYILHQQRVLLGDEMGLGKTVQAIAAMVALRNAGQTHFLVVCPASVLTNWCREVEKMSDLPVVRVHGAGRTKALNMWRADGGVAITTYETANTFKLDDFRFAMLTVDEAHYIKNPSARRTQSVKALCAQTDRLLFMTGTALENRVDEMVLLIGILQPAVAQEVSSMKFLATAPQFRKAVAPVYYRRRREDVLQELPDLTEQAEWCQMLPAEKKLYEDTVLERNFMAIRRLSWNVPDWHDSCKALRLREIVEEAKLEDRKVIVFSFFLDTLQKVAEMLGPHCASEPITGSVAPARRQEIIDEFDAAPAGSVLVAQIQSGGTGLNIQSASVVVICEPQFKPSTENQAISRAYRMGQSRNVLVYRLLCDDTIDEKLMDLLASKQEVFDAFADKSIAAEMHGGVDGSAPLVSDDGSVPVSEVSEKKFGELVEEEVQRILIERGELEADIEGTAI